MERPKEAIERMRRFYGGESPYVPTTDECIAILAYLDWLEGKHICEWPGELTLERLEYYAKCIELWEEKIAIALRALAAVAPQKRKRVVNLWLINGATPDVQPSVFREEYDPNGNAIRPDTWRKVAGPIEIED